MQLSISDLCDGFPDEFKVYLEYCRALRFDDCPDYAYLRRLFHDLMKRKVNEAIFREWQQFPNDGVYDWMDESLAHNPAALPKHCVDSSGHLRRDLLRPAPLCFRENRLLAGRASGARMRRRRGGSGREPIDPIDWVGWVGAKAIVGHVVAVEFASFVRGWGGWSVEISRRR